MLEQCQICVFQLQINQYIVKCTSFRSLNKQSLLFKYQISLIFFIYSYFLTFILLFHSKYLPNYQTRIYVIIIKLMNIKDFEGIYKWKFLIPSLYIMSFLLAILGPIYFPYGYQIFCFMALSYSLIKSLDLSIGALVGLIMYYVNINELKSKDQAISLNSEQRVEPNQRRFYHTIIIPNYEEEEEVLLQTLHVLSQSKRAKTQFIILLAMEGHEAGSQQKALKLIGQIKDKFLFIAYTLHQLRQFQAKGKASNVSWCAQHIEQIIPKSVADLNQILLTIIDADSWAPPEYFDLVQLRLQQKPQIKDLSMFCAPQIYTRNHLQVPVISRLYDQLSSMIHFGHISAFFYVFPLSNYTFSYNLAKKIGWWDTCADAIGQDFHTNQKVHWKIDQPFTTYPLYVPFNQLSISTGKGYFSDVGARFQQAKRHALGVADFAYSWNMLFNNKFKFRNFILTLIITEVFAICAIVPFTTISLSIQYKTQTINKNIIYFEQLYDILANLSIIGVLAYFLYQWWKRVSQARIYKQQTDPIWRLLQFVVVFVFAFTIITIPTFIIASFAVLCNIEYIRADKVMSKKIHPEVNNESVIVHENSREQLNINQEKAADDGEITKSKSQQSK